VLDPSDKSTLSGIGTCAGLATNQRFIAEFGAVREISRARECRNRIRSHAVAFMDK
jgi:hypothetical protein